MTKRGRILRDTNAGPGLLTVEGTQYTFNLEGVWRSDVPPRTGMPVEVAFDHQGAPQEVRAIAESQLAKEQANQALDVAKRQGGAIAQNALARFGAGTLGMLALLALGWFFLSMVSLEGMGGAGLDFTFWQLLTYVNSIHALSNLTQGGPGTVDSSSGIFGLLAFVAFAGPLLRYFWKDRLATLGGLLPLLFMMLCVFILRSHIVGAARAVRGLVGAREAEQALNMFMPHVNWGVGAYISILCCLYFAFVAIRRFLITSA